MRWTTQPGGLVDKGVQPPGGLTLAPKMRALDLMVVSGNGRSSFSLCELTTLTGLFAMLRHLKVMPLPDDLPHYIDLDIGSGDLPNLTSLHLVCNEVSGPINAPNLTSLVLKIQCVDCFDLNWRLFDGCNQLRTVAIASDSNMNLNGRNFPVSLQSLCLDVYRLKERSGLDFSAGNALSLMQVSFHMPIKECIDLTAFLGASRQDCTCSIILQDRQCLISMPPGQEDTWQRLASRSDKFFVTGRS